MIAACPRCTTRFRLGAERLRDEGVRLRCTRCQAVFRVYPPRAELPRRRDDPAVEAELTPPPRPPERERMVLVADPDPERGKASAAELGRLGLHPLLVHDGVEALLTLQRSLPARVLLDVTLGRLSGAELCEVVKRNASLRSTRVVLAGSADALADVAVLRAAGLGPDAMIEHADLPGALASALRLSRDDSRSVAASFAAEPSPALRPEPTFSSHPEPLSQPGTSWQVETASRPEADAAIALDPTPSSVDLDPEIARAERLARIVVSDIVLYNADRFARAVREGDVFEALADQIAEARQLFRQRVASSLCEERDFLAEELQRVTQSREPR